MTRYLMAGAAALAIAAFSTGSYAVDITNEDSQTHHVTTIGDGGFAAEHEILAGQTIKGICEECTLVLAKDLKILTDEPAANASGNQQASIKDGKFKVQ